MGLKKDFASREPTEPLDVVCLSVQRDAVRRALQTEVAYLRRWQVDIKACIEDENKKST